MFLVTMYEAGQLFLCGCGYTSIESGPSTLVSRICLLVCCQSGVSGVGGSLLTFWQRALHCSIVSTMQGL